MQVKIKKVSKEEYLDYKENPKGMCDRFASRHLGVSDLYGYGFYGMQLMESEGEYYVRYELGDSCE